MVLNCKWILQEVVEDTVELFAAYALLTDNTPASLSMNPEAFFTFLAIFILLRAL